MKFTGYTDGDDWNVRTLLSVMRHGKNWDAGVDWKDWHLDAWYTWYDGPIWQVRVGPFWVAIGCWS